MADQLTSGAVKFTISADGKQAISTLGNVSEGFRKVGDNARGAAKEAREFKKIGDEMASGNMNMGGIAGMGMKAMGVAGAAGGIAGNLLAGAITGLIDMAMENVKEEIEKAKAKIEAGTKAWEEELTASGAAPGMTPMQFQEAVKGKDVKTSLSALKALAEEKEGTGEEATDKEKQDAIDAAASMNKIGLYSPERLKALVRMGIVGAEGTAGSAENIQKMSYQMTGMTDAQLKSVQGMSDWKSPHTSEAEFNNYKSQYTTKNVAAIDEANEREKQGEIQAALSQRLEELNGKTDLSDSETQLKERIVEILKDSKKEKDYEDYRESVNIGGEDVISTGTSLKAWKDTINDLVGDQLGLGGGRVRANEEIGEILRTIDKRMEENNNHAKKTAENTKPTVDPTTQAPDTK